MKVNSNDMIAKLAINKSLLKEYSSSEYSRIVYLRNNSEFQIQLFNPYTYTIGAEIFINGKTLYNKVILKPGERVWVERYFDSPNKFLFTTYEVGKSEEVKKAIQNNGEIKIQFYKEQETRINYTPNITYVNNDSPWWQSYQTYCCDDVKFTSQLANYYCSLDSSVNQTKCCADTPQTLGLVSKGLGKLRSLSSNKQETGRVEKGNISEQQIHNVNINLEYFAFKEEIIKILPESQKPISSNDLKKIYCTNCGRKLNQKYKYCPYCGAKVDFCPNNNQQENKNYIIEKCPNCGRNVRSTMMECPHCGEILR